MDTITVEIKDKTAFGFLQYMENMNMIRVINKKFLRYFFLMPILFVLFSCSPKIIVNLKKQKKYQPLEIDFPVIIYKEPQQIPIEYETLGKIQISCFDGISKNCETNSIFLSAETEARKIGGNALLIKKHEKPSFWNSHYLLKADIIKVWDFASPPDYRYTKRKPKIMEIYGKNTWDLRLSLPHINHFVLKPDGERTISNCGFGGALIGVDYYHQNTQYLSLFTAAGMDFFLPVLVGVDWDSGEEEFCSSAYIGLTNNHRYQHFTFGYGLSYSHNSWSHVYHGDYNNDGSYDDIPPVREYDTNSLGLLFSTYWLSKRNFSIGLIYRPNFIHLNIAQTLKYEHLISVDFAWKIRLKTTNRRK